MEYHAKSKSGYALDTGLRGGKEGTKVRRRQAVEMCGLFRGQKGRAVGAGAGAVRRRIAWGTMRAGGGKG